jgi:hypothetical protein
LKKFKKDSDNLRNRFNKRNKKVLKQTYEDREKRSSMFGERKGIFNQELLEELGITEFKPNSKQDGIYFGEILPCSFDSDDSYFKEVSVHYQVGMNNDQFVCVQRLRNGPCFRCREQKKLYNIHKTTTNEIKALFPSDRVIYLWWNRTDELANEKPQTYGISIWAAPKKGVHAEIQSKTRNKLTKEIIDISDISEDGEGKTIYFEVAIKKTESGDSIPTYEGFDLVDREEPIPDEIVEKLSDIIDELKNRMTKEMTSPLETLLHIPPYEEIEEAMADEIYDDSEKQDDKKSKNKSKKEKLSNIQNEEESDDEESDDEQSLEELEEELKGMSKLGILRYMREKGLKKYADSELDKSELIDKILYIQSGDDIPF